MDKPNDYKHVIRDALKVFDDNFVNNNELYHKLYVHCEAEHTDNNIKFYYKNNKQNKERKIFKSYKSEIIGQAETIRNPQTLNNIHLWTWAWADVDIKKSEKRAAFDIFKWAFNTDTIDKPLKELILNATQRFSSSVDFEIFTSLALYLSKADYIYVFFYVDSEGQERVRQCHLLWEEK